MKLYLNNIGIISNSIVEIEGLTIVAGLNQSGKTTIGKILFSIYNAIENIELKNQNDKMVYGRRVLIKIFRQSELQLLKGMRNNDDFFLFKYSNAPLPQFSSIPELVSFLNETKDSLLSFNSLYNEKSFPESGKEAFLSFSTTNVTRLIKEIDDCIGLFALDPELTSYTENWIAKTIGQEMCNQVQPIKLENIESTIRITEGDSSFVNINIKDKNSYDVTCNRFAKGIDNTFLIDSVLDLDQAYCDIRDNDSVDITDEEMPPEFYKLLNSRNASTHNKKNRNVLSQNQSKTILEEGEIANTTKEVFESINKIIPGSFSSTINGMFYVLDGGTELNVKNLASGAKLFSMIKILLSKGLITNRTLLILDEPECHLHPRWQRDFAEIITVMVKQIGVKVLLTTHNPNFLLALDTFSYKHSLRDLTFFYRTQVGEDNYMAEVKRIETDDIRSIYAELSRPLLELDALRTELIEKQEETSEY